jgi:hypothetical protein
MTYQVPEYIKKMAEKGYGKIYGEDRKLLKDHNNDLRRVLNVFYRIPP